MKEKDSFLWHDYETFGIHPAFDRPSQFAALRTNAALEPIAEPVVWYCAPANDVLPHPAACLITGITPQQARREGRPECEFARLIDSEMSQPNTCVVGFNNLAFDDEFTRHLFYRNFFEPYEREYKNGNSRFDLINLLRMTHALRPQGVAWPVREDGSPSFRLEDLTRSNGIEHADAHDALSDVRATLAMARLLLKAQPKLFAWALRMRQWKFAFNLLDPVASQPLLHTSSRYSASRGCTTLVLPLAVLPDRPKSVIVIDLMSPPEQLLDHTAETIADLVFTPSSDLPDDMERIPLKAVHSNKVPMLAPIGTLRGVDTDRIGLDEQRCLRNASVLQKHLEPVRLKVLQVFERQLPEVKDDPDNQLYSGGFFSAHDRALFKTIRHTPPDQLGNLHWPFQDRRLTTMLFRYRARNYPESLTPDELARWNQDRSKRLVQAPLDGQISLDDFNRELQLARSQQPETGPAQGLLDALEDWVRSLNLTDA